MVERDRELKEIFDELFKGNQAALRKYARTRQTEYEMRLWYDQGLPLEEVDDGAKYHFATSFLSGNNIRTASGAELEEAFDRLHHAVVDGCHGRCYRLVEELNESLTDLGLAPVDNIERFLNWLTFAYKRELDNEGNQVMEKPYMIPCLKFFNERNLNEFWKKIQGLLRRNKMISMQDVFCLVMIDRKTVDINKGD